MTVRRLSMTRFKKERSMALFKDAVAMAREVRTGWEAIVDLALAEDIGTGDVTTLATVPEGAHAEGVIIAKEAGIISGLDVAAFVFRRINPMVDFSARVTDGTKVE